eukprot:gene4552-825_t
MLTPHTQPHPNDTIVLIDGLTSAAGISLNGSLATVIGWDQELGRHSVQLPGRDPVRVLLQNLLLPPTEDHAVEEEENEEEDGDEEEHTDTKQGGTAPDVPGRTPAPPEPPQEPVAPSIPGAEPAHHSPGLSTVVPFSAHSPQDYAEELELETNKARATYLDLSESAFKPTCALHVLDATSDTSAPLTRVQPTYTSDKPITAQAIQAGLDGLAAAEHRQTYQQHSDVVWHAIQAEQPVQAVLSTHTPKAQNSKSPQKQVASSLHPRSWIALHETKRPAERWRKMMTPAERAPYDVDDAIVAVIEGPSPMPQAINPSKKELEYIIKQRDLDASSQSFHAAKSFKILTVPNGPGNQEHQEAQMTVVLSSPTLRQLLRTCDIGTQLRESQNEPEESESQNEPPPQMDVPGAHDAVSMWIGGTQGHADDDNDDDDDR